MNKVLYILLFVSFSTTLLIDNTLVTIGQPSLDWHYLLPTVNFLVTFIVALWLIDDKFGKKKKPNILDDTTDKSLRERK